MELTSTGLTVVEIFSSPVWLVLVSGVLVESNLSCGLLVVELDSGAIVTSSLDSGAIVIALDELGVEFSELNSFDVYVDDSLVDDGTSVVELISPSSELGA